MSVDWIAECSIESTINQQSTINIQHSTISGSAERCGQQGDHDFVVADERVAMARSGCRPGDYVGLRTIAAYEVQIHRRQAVERDAFVARERDRLQKDLRQHDRRAAVQIDAAPEPRDVRDEIPEVAQAAVAERS